MAGAFEITFAIGATIAGNFNAVMGKAGSTMGELQKKMSTLSKSRGKSR